MVAPSAVRVKLLFDFPPPAVPQSSMLWLLVDQTRCRVVADLSSVIRDRYFYGQPGGLSLYVESCLLPPGESILLVRDNDCVKVKWDESYLEDPPKSGTIFVSPSKKTKKRHCPRSEDDEDAVGIKPKKLKADSQQILKAVSDPESVKKTKRKKSRRDVSSDIHSDESADEAKKSQKEKVKKKTKTLDVTKAPTAVNETKKTLKSKKAKNLCDDSLMPSSKHTQENKANTSVQGAKTVFTITETLTSSKKAKKKASSSSSSDTDSSKDLVTNDHGSKSKETISPQPLKISSVDLQRKDDAESSDSDTFVIKKTIAATNSSVSDPLHIPNGNSPVPVGVPQGPLPKSCAMGRGLGRGRGDFPWRGQCSRGFRMRGGHGNPGRGRDNENFFKSYDKDTLKQQQLNEPVTNRSFVIQNPPDMPKKDYNALPLLAAPPQTGTRIAFKLLELTENYTPEVSDYKEGKLLNYDPLTKELEVEILSRQTKEKEPGKFDLVYQTEDGTDIVEYAVTQESKIREKWSSLIEPRLIVEYSPEGPGSQAANIAS
ncbi:coilin [Pelobates fuscus]|uniref:coilin n=1 Tax=Pelobates fuscus TaxID=191477 RepID=UPI002FE47CD2